MADAPPPRGAPPEVPPFLPVRPWRRFLAFYLDYLGFGLLWDVGVRYLTVGGRPAGWMVPAVFVLLEAFAVRHVRTPGMRLMGVVRLAPDPAPGEAAPKVRWLVEGERARRENGLSLTIGLLFLLEGLRWVGLVLVRGPWATDPVPGPADLLPLVPILGWGLFLLDTGGAFLGLKRRARVDGAIAVGLTMVSVLTRPDAWGGWIVGRLAEHRAALGAPLEAGEAARLAGWVPPGLLLLCAGLVAVILLNRAPFRRAREKAPGPNPARAPEAPSASRPAARFDVPVGRAMQATALAMALGVLCIGAGVASARAWGARLDVESRAFVETAVRRAAARWDPKDLAPLTAGALRVALTDGLAAADFARYARLGPLVEPPEADGAARVRVLVGDPMQVSASYRVEAAFEHGPARIDVELLRDRGRWVTLRFEVTTPDVPPA